MNSKEVALMASCTPQNIRKKTKQALEGGKNVLHVKGKTFAFKLVKNKSGKAYEYLEIDNKNTQGASGDTRGDNNKKGVSPSSKKSRMERGSDSGNNFFDDLQGDNGYGCKNANAGFEPNKNKYARQYEKSNDRRHDSDISKGDLNENTSRQPKKNSSTTPSKGLEDSSQREARDCSQGASTLCEGQRLGRSDEKGKDGLKNDPTTDLSNTLHVRPRKTSEAFLKAPKKDQDEAILKYRLVQEYESRQKMTTKEFLKELSYKYECLGVTEQKLYRWLREAREAIKQDINPLDVLLDMRGRSEKPKALSDEMISDIGRMLLENPDRRAKKIEKFLRDIYGEEVPEYTTITRAINAWKDKHRLIYEFAKNPDQAIGTLRPAYGSANECVSYPNQLWELDATPADIITSDGKRHTLSAAIDVHSRRVVVVLAKSASYTTLGRVMKKGILKLGVPECVKTDNGKDYTSNYFDYTCARLRINHELVPPYQGWKKPFVERFFRTLSTDLFEELDGYCGHNISERQAIQNRQTFEHKLESIKLWRTKQKSGDEFAKRWAIKKENRGMEITLPINKDELARWIDSWIEVYENRVHRGIKTTPLKQYNKSSQPIRTISDERVLDILVGATVERKVQKNGINLFGLEYVANELWAYSKQRVTIYTDDDLSVIYVYDMEQNFICKAENPELVGRSRMEYMEAGKSFDRAAKKIYKALRTIREDAPNRMIRSLTKEIMDIGANVDSKHIEYKEVHENLGDIKQALLTETKDAQNNMIEEDTALMFDSPYDRFMHCLEMEKWDELSLKLKEKFPDDYERAYESYKIFKTA